MRYSTMISLAALAGPSLVLALPRGNRQAVRSASDVDIKVLQFAEALQHLEGEFYNQSLAKFQSQDFVNVGFNSPDVPVQQLAQIANDEATHAAVLGAVLTSLGSAPISGCQFNFDSVLSDVGSVAAVARLVENVGVGAYLGAAQSISDKSILSAAGTILTVEARHQTVMNILSGTGSTIPSAFDLALLPGEVLAIAGPFVSGCDLGFPANTPLTITNQGAVTPGMSLTFTSANLNSTVDPSKLYCSFLTGGAGFSAVLNYTSCTVPAGINGPVAIWITSDDNPLAGNPAVRATNKVIAGPTMVFVDSAAPQAIPQLVRGSASASSSSGQSVSSGGSSEGSSSEGSSSGSSSDGSSSTDSSSGASATSSAEESSSTDSSQSSSTDSAASSSGTSS